MNPNLAALQSLVALVAQAIKAGEAAAQPGQSSLQRILDFEGVAPAVLAFLPQIGNLSLAGLMPSDYVSLAESLVTDLGFSNAHAKAIIDASFQLVNNAVKYTLPDVQALVAAIKAAPSA